MKESTANILLKNDFEQESTLNTMNTQTSFFLKLAILALISFSLMGRLAFAGAGGDDKKETELQMLQWYNDFRFAAADLNKDGLLDKNELRKAAIDWAHYQDQRYFRRADRDIDNKLSKMESLLMVRFEDQAKQMMDKARFEGVMNHGQGKAQVYDYAYAKQNPHMAKKLMASKWWLDNNKETAKKLYTDEEWMAANPAVGGALANNRIWLATNPKAALFLFDTYPDLVKKNASTKAFAAAQKQFVETHPVLGKELKNALKGRH